jgi:hypothetical protein
MMESTHKGETEGKKITMKEIIERKKKRRKVKGGLIDYFTDGVLCAALHA